MPQELLGYHLGLIVPKDVEHLFWNVKTGKRPPVGYGTGVQKDAEIVNKSFAKLGIPLRMKLLHVSQFDEESFVKYLKTIEKLNKDVLACFDHGVLRGDDKHGGHVCLIDRVDSKRKEVRLIDPSANQPKWRIVKIKRLLSAMQFQGFSKSSGFWELRKI